LRQLHAPAEVGRDRAGRAPAGGVALAVEQGDTWCLRQEPGFAGALSLVDRQSGNAILIVLWTTADQATGNRVPISLWEVSLRV